VEFVVTDTDIRRAAKQSREAPTAMSALKSSIGVCLAVERTAMMKEAARMPADQARECHAEEEADPPSVGQRGWPRANRVLVAEEAVTERFLTQGMA
jgi:hypothetical protein